jgi:glycosyltransferase involved in cell wall biosynthesis
MGGMAGLKIAFYNLTTTVTFGGIETFNREMARTLARRGHTVHIFGGRGPLRLELPEVTVHSYPFLRRTAVPDLGTRCRKFVERLSFGVCAFKDLVKGRYDLIYISKPYDLPVALAASSRSGAKTVFGSGGTEFFPGYHYLVRRVDHFFACSEFNASQIEQYCGIRPQVLPNGVDTALFRPLHPEQRLRDALQISDKEGVVVSACRLVGWKGIEYSIKAVAELLHKGIAVRYLILGEGKDRERLEKLAESMGVSRGVLFLGSVRNAELPCYYSIADIAVFPSIADETFGIAIAEAMACGVPVVSTVVGGIPEVVSGESGILVPPKDDISLARAMEKLLTGEDIRRKMGNEGRKWVTQNFSWDVIAERFEKYIAND